MIRRAASLVALLAISLPAWACDVPRDRDDESLRFVVVAFVGTVVGYRLDDTSLTADLPDCPNGTDDKLASDVCRDFWERVVSVQFDVETPIKGVEAHRKYETVTRNDDGCAPRPGERWLTSGWYRDGLSRLLERPPTQAQIDQWRSIATTEPSN